jgi:nicotinamidase-related amidase
MTTFPTFYDPQRIGTLFYPDMSAIASEADAANLPPASGDTLDVQLVAIDMQIDFCHEQGSLYVPGAPADIRRLVEFIYHNAAHITGITCSLDSHLPYQIFHPSWWADEQGQHPAPFTLITYEQIEQGKWRPLRDPQRSREYVRTLEQEAKKTLTIWPYHVGIGSIGHALDPQLWAAVMWHSLARKVQPAWITKGTVPQTEHYSIIQPEVPAPEHPQGETNQALLDHLAASDIVLLAGEAKSHCVLETLEDLVEAFAGQPELLQKIYLLRDCTSSVVHPEVDFDALANEQLETFASKGIHLIDSTDPLPFID